MIMVTPPIARSPIAGTHWREAACVRFLSWKSLFLVLQAMWRASLQQCPCPVEDRFDLASLCLLSEGQSAASIQQVSQHFPAIDRLDLAAADIHIFMPSYRSDARVRRVCADCAVSCCEVPWDKAGFDNRGRER